MAEGSRSTVVIVPLNGTNYGTWKVQAKMALLKEGLWISWKVQRLNPQEELRLLVQSLLDVVTKR